jgi:FixJ family two-component response regulator
MPGTSGPELARVVRHTHPHIKILFMSGYTDQAVSHHGVLEADSQFIQKPFTTDLLLGKVRAMLDGKE